MLKVYEVLITTTFKKRYTVEAESPEDAKKQFIEGGDFDDAIDTNDFETEVEVLNGGN